MFTVKQASIEVRNLLSEESPALVGLPLPRIQAMIPVALEDYARKCFADGRKRQQFKQKIELEITNGEKDLTDYTDGTQSRIHLPDATKTTVSGDEVFSWVGSKEQLFYGRSGSYNAFLDGYVLYLKAEGEDYTGDAFLTVPVFPADTTEIPLVLQKDFVSYAANFVRTQMGVNGNG